MIMQTPGENGEGNEEELPQENSEERPTPQIYPDFPLELLQICDLRGYSYDIGTASPEQREIILGRVLAESNEQWASEALQIDQTFSVEEQELLVSIISDPNLSSILITLCMERGWILTDDQKEKLMSQVEADEDAALALYNNFEGAGIIEEANEDEQWFIDRLKKVLGM